MDVSAENDNNKSGVNYVYIESPYIESGMEQNIVVSLKKEETKLSNPVLILEDEEGNQKEWICEKNIDNLYLFSGEITDEKEKVYKAVSVNTDGMAVTLSHLNSLVQFGVNTLYDGYGENMVPLEADNELLEATIVSVAENGKIESENDIEEALEDAGVMTINPKARTNSSIVIALDPGHDARHAGATANGLLEHELTLKIANYCKEELEKYDNVEIYMTREDESCPYPATASSGKCIEQRAIAAAAAGAQIYVSMHLNAQAGGTTANGAEVIFPNDSWKENVGNQGEALAQSIQDELVKLGLTDRGIYTKDTTIGEIYEDGSISDYYAVQIYNKRNGIPGIIIEHAFITNKNDVNNFLKTEDGLKKLGLADATGIANYLGLSMNSSNTNESQKTIEDGYYYISSGLNDKYTISIENSSIEADVSAQLHTLDYTLSQIFEVKHQGKGKYTIKNVNSQKYLTSEESQDGIQANVCQKAYSNNDSQYWFIQDNVDGTYSFINVANRLALDVRYAEVKNGSKIQTYSSNQTGAQKFWCKKTDVITNGVYSIGLTKNKDFVLDIAGASVADEANLQIYRSNGIEAQSFYLEYEEGYYVIRNTKSGKVLDAKYGGSTSGTNVWQYTENNSAAQKWTIKENEDGSYTIISVLSGLVLDVENGVFQDSTNVQLYESNNTNAQKFCFNEIEYELQGDFYIRSALDDYYVLDVKNGDIADEANVQLYEINETLAQRFEILRSNDGYIIKNVKSGKVLDVKYGGTVSGTNVWQYTRNDTLAQKWDIIRNQDGTYTFISKLNGLALDVTNAICENGSNIQVYEANGTKAQRFKLEKIY